MKIKIALVCIVTLILSMVGYGTYAYMTASKTVQNITSTGTVKIELSQDFKESGKESGGLYRLSEDIRAIMPSSNVERTLIVKNVGKNACYVRVKFVPEFISAAGDTLPSYQLVAFNTNSDDWTKSGDWYYYNNSLDPDNPDNMETKNLLKSIHFKESIGNEYKNATFNLSILAQAVQAKNNGSDPLNAAGWLTPTPTTSAG